jgi:hypothetical protein
MRNWTFLDGTFYPWSYRFPVETLHDRDAGEIVDNILNHSFWPEKSITKVQPVVSRIFPPNHLLGIP